MGSGWLGSFEREGMIATGSRTFPSFRLLRFCGAVSVPQVALSCANASCCSAGQGPFLKVAEVPPPDEPPEELEPPQAAHPSANMNARATVLHSVS